MTRYLSYKFEDSDNFVTTYDELPLWSAQFGLMLLDHIDYKPNQTIVDIGTGTGFPLMELASRFGDSCTCYGVDIWATAMQRAEQKVNNYGLHNVQLVNSSAANLPFEDNSTDLIISNLGINNFEDAPAVFKECNRVLKPGGKLALTTNLKGHWAEFYKIFQDVLNEMNLTDLAKKLQSDEERRGTIETTATLFTNAGFSISKVAEDSFSMKFASGSAFLNHHFVKLGWLGTWRGLLQSTDEVAVFTQLEERLNNLSENGGLQLTVPMAFVEGMK